MKADIFRVLGWLLLIIAIFHSGRMYQGVNEIARRTEPYSILEVESEFGITLFVPTVRELQEHAVRHGAEMPIDNDWGKLTRDGIEEVRIKQEAAIHNTVYRKVAESED